MARKLSLAAAAAALALLLTACDPAQEAAVQEALTFRTDLLASEACTYTAEVTADFGERLYAFTLDCTYHPADNGAELTVRAPEAIAGIAASVDGETATVRFEDVALELGGLAGGRVAPLQLPQLLGDAWAYGYVESQAAEGDGWLVTYRTGYEQEELLVFTRLDAGLTPVQAEIYADGVCVLTAELSDFGAA